MVNMASFWDSISDTLGWFFGYEDSDDDDDDYLPPPRGGKRKAREELQRPSYGSKARRYSAPSSSARSPTGYLDDSESDEPDFLARSVSGDSGTEIESAYPPNIFMHRDSLYLGRPKDRSRARSESLRPRSISRFDFGYHSKHPSRRKRSTTDARGWRPNFLKNVSNTVVSVAKSLVPGTAADERQGLTEADIQAQLLQTERRIQLAAEESDSKLSDGAWGRKYWARPPWDSRKILQELGEVIPEEEAEAEILTDDAGGLYPAADEDTLNTREWEERILEERRNKATEGQDKHLQEQIASHPTAELKAGKKDGEDTIEELQEQLNNYGDYVPHLEAKIEEQARELEMAKEQFEEAERQRKENQGRWEDEVLAAERRQRERMESAEKREREKKAAAEKQKIDSA